jgi:hypothetical protein
LNPRAHALPLYLSLAAIQQFSGINAIIAYAPTIMEKTGLTASNAILYSVMIGTMNVGATIVSRRLIDADVRSRWSGTPTREAAAW